MGGTASSLNIETNGFLAALRDSRQPNEAIKWSELVTLSELYPDVLKSEQHLEELRAVCRAVIQQSSCTGRFGGLCKSICGIIAGHSANRPEEVPYQQVCSLLLLLQILMQTLLDETKGCTLATQKLCEVDGADVSHIIIDTMVAFMVKHPVLNMNTACLNAHCMVLSVATIACGAQLWSNPNDLQQLGIESADQSLLHLTTPLQENEGHGTQVVDLLASHGSAHMMTQSLLSYITKAEFSSVDISSRGTLGTIWDYTFGLLNPWGKKKGVQGGHNGERRHSTISSGDAHVSLHIGGEAGGGVSSAMPPSSHLGRRAALLLCVLLYRRKNTAKVAPSSVMEAFRAEHEDFPVANLYDVFCRPGALCHPEMILLLYSLLIENSVTLDHILNANDVGRLVLPLTHVLHNIDALFDHPSSLYVLLSVLLMLSQYRRFNAGIHQQSIPYVDWNPGRPAWKDITAGSVLIVTLIKAIQTSISSGHDEYVTRQAFSILSNMGADIRGMHEHTSRRLIQLVIFLAKSACKSMDMDHRGRCFEYLRNVLSCVALCLHQEVIADNIQLVYELLHQVKALRHALDDLKKLEGVDESLVRTLGHLVETLDYFSDSLDKDIGVAAPDVSAVTNSLMKIATSNWSTPLTETPVPDRYGFAEGDVPETFFVPYSWELVLGYYSVEGSACDWESSELPLFSKQSDEEEEADSPKHQQV